MNLSIPDHYRDHLRVGTCSWKYDSWKGLVYEEGRRYRAGDYLVDYSRRFDTVEVDQWFWSLFPSELRLPDRATVESYAESVPRDFVFTVKAPNSITLTHFYAKQPPQHRAFANRPNEHFLSVELVERFLARLEPLRGRLGPVMFQFEYLNTAKMPSADAFFERLDEFLSRLPAGYQYAIETRNAAYLGDAFFGLLRRHNVGAVLLDGYRMPPPGRVFENHGTRTSSFMVLRLHGPDRAGIERVTLGEWSRIVQPQERGLRAAVDIVRRNTIDFVTTYVNVNNHYEGSAPLTIERFLDALRKEERAC
jgi:uncharacterized protein YecE (DUF72 family)